MAIDILQVGRLQALERELQLPETDRELGRFFGGEEATRRLGRGMEIDGLRDYQIGDDSRHIDWLRSDTRIDEGLYLRQFYTERSPLRVLVSDIPSDRYRNTIGDLTNVNNPEDRSPNARTLGFVAASLLLRGAISENGAILPVWSIGEEVYQAPLSRALTGKSAVKKALVHGRDLAKASTDVTEARVVYEASRKRRGPKLELPARETLADAINKAARAAGRIADQAQFVVVSDFRSESGDIDETAAALHRLSRKNQVTAVEITNPLHRGPVEGVEYYAIGGGKSVRLDTQARRDEYSRRVAARQAQITAALRGSTHKVVSLHTADPSLRDSLSRLPRLAA